MLEERLFDAATALAGSGPAFLGLVIEAFEDAGITSGLSAATARALILSTMVGTANVLEVALRDDLTIASLMARKDEVIRGHHAYLGAQLARNGVEVWHGRGRFVSPHEIEVCSVLGERRTARAVDHGDA